VTECELWRAQSGKIHAVRPPGPLYDAREQNRTWCSTQIVSGPRWQGQWDNVTCSQCAKMFDRQPARDAREEREARAEFYSSSADDWWPNYNLYLESDHWAVTRHMVMTLYGWQCQECGGRADHVHHIFYPRGVTPGSAAWIRAQKLYHLVPLCRGCHDNVHGRTFYPRDAPFQTLLPR
jgi:hypothetical protein